MSTTPMQALERPFAIEPITQVMLPDGIFDNAIYNLRIACHYTNQSTSDLTNVTLYLESVGDPGIAPVARTYTFPVVPAGASVLVMWDANFQHATPGKRLVSFVARADGFQSRRSIQTIWVSETRYDAVTNTYTCTVEEGTLKMSEISAIGPSDKDRCCCEDKEHDCPPDYGPYVPTGATMVWTPNPAYAGPHGDLPLGDPWWKVLAVIVAIVAAIVAIVAAVMGAGTASVSAGGTFDESDPSVDCCTPKMPPGEYTVAGVASSIATGALIVALTDAADPFWRGQAATPPAGGELTVAERVVASWTLPDAPNAGAPYTADVKWTYTRFTDNGQSYQHSVTETTTNVHVCDDVTVTTPDTVPAYEPLWVKATFTKPDNVDFVGPELYAFAIFRSPQGLGFVVPMVDDGMALDEKANDAVYTGWLDLREAHRRLIKEGHDDCTGVWRVYVFAQDIRNAPPGSAPEVAAQYIGGMFVASAIQLTFDPSLPCPLKAQGAITVV